MTVHDFKERLEFSEVAKDEPFWKSVYKKAFPDMVNMMPCIGDTLSQRKGIDRLILLGSGRVIKIDEKKRESQYNDILLEYISVDTTNAPGWIEKPLVIDYLAYAFMPTRKVYLFPWDMLRRAWLHYKKHWMNSYPKIVAANNGYNTISVAVPISVLSKAISVASIIEVATEL